LAIAECPERREPFVDLAQYFYEVQDWEKMAKKRNLSSKGTVLSAASCSTLSLKYSQLISLFKNGIFLEFIQHQAPSFIRRPTIL
jgi:hypothetical protein